MLQGIAVIALVLPLFNLTAWANPEPVPTIRNLRELAALMVMGAVLVLAVQSDFEALLLPLAVASALGTVVLLTLVMTVIALIVMQRSSTATHWSQLVVPLLGAGWQPDLDRPDRCRPRRPDGGPGSAVLTSRNLPPASAY
jgi:hypothetical protein